MTETRKAADPIKPYRAGSRARKPGVLFAEASKRSGHATRDRHERFRERDHLDELGD